MKMKLRTSTVFLMLIVLAVGGYQLINRMKSDARPPVIERKVEVTTPNGIAPVPEFLLRHKEELALTEVQQRKISDLASAYRKDVAPLRRQLDAAVKNYQQYMDRAGKGPRPDTQKLQAQGGGVQHLSGVMAATRQAYWEQGRKMLTEEQQKKVDRLLPRATIEDLR